MKYPACILAGEGAKGTCVTIAFASAGQFQDTGAKMIHLAPNTTSQIISKSLCRGGGKVNYRGTVRHAKKATNAKSAIKYAKLLRVTKPFVKAFILLNPYFLAIYLLYIIH